MTTRQKLDFYWGMYGRDTVFAVGGFVLGLIVAGIA